MTTYQRLKAENKELTRQLLILVQKPNSSEAELIRMQWRIRADVEKACMYGNYEIPTQTKGLIPQLKNKL